MAFLIHSFSCILRLSSSDVPVFLTNDRRLQDKTHSLFSSFVTSADGTSISNAFVVAPVALKLEAVEDRPVGIKGMPRLHHSSGGLEWEISVEMVDLEPMINDLYKHSSIGKLSIVLERVHGVLPSIVPLLVSQSYVVEVEDENGQPAQYW